jgi:radical SAM superfamily enzyme YgiQ (UPF0313 family)
MCIDVLLIFPPAPRFYTKKAFKVAEFSSPPLGLCYIAAILEKNGFSVAIEDMHIDQKNTKDVIDLVKKHKPKIVGISSSTPTYPNAKEIARYIRRSSNIPIIIGGIHATMMPRECLEDGFDAVVRGEGESTMLELAEFLIRKRGNLENILGISYRKREKSKHTPARPFIKDLDDLPFPARHLIDLKKYHQEGAIISSRGCPAKCIFCSCGAFSGRRYRFRSPENVVKEVEEMIDKFGVKQFEFHDDTMTVFQDRMKKICRLLKPLGVEWGCQSRINAMDYKLAKIMCDAGCRAIQFGVESGNQKILDSIKKGITLEVVEKAVSAAKGAGIPNITCSFMIGHPEDTKKTVRDTIRFAKRLRKMGVITPISVLTPYPGTDIFEKRRKYGIKILSTNWDEYTFSRIVIETKNLKENDLRDLYIEGLTEAVN